MDQGIQIKHALRRGCVFASLGAVNTESKNTRLQMTGQDLESTADCFNNTCTKLSPDAPVSDAKVGDEI